MDNIIAQSYSVQPLNTCGELVHDADLTWVDNIELTPEGAKSHLQYNIWHCLSGRLFISNPHRPSLECKYVLIRFNTHQFLAIVAGMPVSPITSFVIRHICRRLWPHRHCVDVSRELGELNSDPCTLISERVFLLSWSDDIRNYFHLVFDICARIDAINEKGMLDQNRLFILGKVPKLANTVIQYLYPISAGRLFSVDEKKVVLKHCDIPLSIEPSYLDASFILRTNHRINYFLKSYQSKSCETSSHKKIYVKRGRSRNGRNLLNEGELVDSLSEFGFTSVTMDEYDVAEQWNIFRNARLIVSPHGAALTNLLAQRPGSTILELLPYDFHPRTYEYIAKALSVNYIKYLYGSSDRPGVVNVKDVGDLLSCL